MDSAVNKGFLRESFRLFHLSDSRLTPVQVHFHEFSKAVIMLGGSVTYTVEGESCPLCRGDVLLVPHHEVHRPIFSDEGVYERAVLWIDPAYLGSLPGDPGMCFDGCSARGTHILHPSPELWGALCRAVSALERESASGEYASREAQAALFELLMITLCRAAASDSAPGSGSDGVGAAVRYIGSHLSGELSIDRLAGLCYLSRYHFMRRFKAETGYTVHGYITLKRMTEASRLLGEGMSASQAAASVGIAEYSTFLRAFRRQFGITPAEFARRGAVPLGSRFSE